MKGISIEAISEEFECILANFRGRRVTISTSPIINKATTFPSSKLTLNNLHICITMVTGKKNDYMDMDSVEQDGQADYYGHHDDYYDYAHDMDL